MDENINVPINSYYIFLVCCKYLEFLHNEEIENLEKSIKKDGKYIKNISLNLDELKKYKLKFKEILENLKEKWTPNCYESLYLKEKYNLLEEKETEFNKEKLNKLFKNYRDKVKDKKFTLTEAEETISTALILRDIILEYPQKIYSKKSRFKEILYSALILKTAKK